MFAILANSPGSRNTLAGSVVFVFVLGLNWFKTSFRFSQANNLPPRSVFFLGGTILAILALTLVMSSVDLVLSGVFRGVTIGLYRQIYPPHILAQLLWSWLASIVSASFGLMVAMVYYRSTPPLKILVSLSPVFVIWLLNHIDKRTGGANSGTGFHISHAGLRQKRPDSHPLSCHSELWGGAGDCYLGRLRSPNV